MTFEPDIEAALARQAEAREAWTSGRHRKLIEGAYYHHCGGFWTRRVLELRGKDVRWSDKYGSSLCTRAVFMARITGPL